MQLLIDGVPNNVPLEALYVCQPPNEAPLVPTRVVQVRPDVFNVPVIVEFPVMDNPLVDVIPLHERDFELLNDIFVLTPSDIANNGDDTETV